MPIAVATSSETPPAGKALVITSLQANLEAGSRTNVILSITGSCTSTGTTEVTLGAFGSQQVLFPSGFPFAEGNDI